MVVIEHNGRITDAEAGDILTVDDDGETIIPKNNQRCFLTINTTNFVITQPNPIVFNTTLFNTNNGIALDAATGIITLPDDDRFYEIFVQVEAAVDGGTNSVLNVRQHPSGTPISNLLRWTTGSDSQRFICNKIIYNPTTGSTQIKLSLTASSDDLRIFYASIDIKNFS